MEIDNSSNKVRSWSEIIFKPLKLNNSKIKQRILVDNAVFTAVHINENLQEFHSLLVH